MKRVVTALTAFCLASAASFPILAANTPVNKPNLILLLADDLGHGYLGVTGSKQIPTPHIDSLAANGVRFSNAYFSSSVCAPSRAGMMTSKHQATFGFRDNLTPVQPGHDPEFIGLPLNQTTLADRLKALGYSTGLIGKWRLGELPKFSPFKRGFDEFWGYLGDAHDYFRAEPGGEKAMAGPNICSFKEPAPLTYLTGDPFTEAYEHREKKEMAATLIEKLRKEYARKPARGRTEEQQ
jgi:arylsulfatase A-like enzyme